MSGGNSDSESSLVVGEADDLVGELVGVLPMTEVREVKIENACDAIMLSRSCDVDCADACTTSRGVSSTSEGLILTEGSLGFVVEQAIWIKSFYRILLHS